MSFLNALGGYTEAFLRLFYPESCGICRAFLRLEETRVCESCRQRTARLRFNEQDQILEDSFSYLDEVWTLYRYESPVREVLTAVKFHGKRRLLTIFEPELAKMIQAVTSLSDYDAFVPIPLDRKKLIERGYNQSEIIAQMMSLSCRFSVQTGALGKPYSTPAQSHLSREERAANLSGSFHAGKPEKIKGKSFLLVDDIVTTGATGEEAARTLKENGAARVDLLALARTELKS